MGRGRRGEGEKVGSDLRRLRGSCLMRGRRERGRGRDKIDTGTRAARGGFIFGYCCLYQPGLKVIGA